MLSPLQERVATIVAGLEEAEDFALSGGAALIVQGTIRRPTRDLDFFGLTPDAVDRLLPRVEEAMLEEGLQVERVQSNHGFARLVIQDGQDRTELDLAADARLFPAQPGHPAPTLTGPELGADKVLAVFGRAEARDFGDLLMLESRYGLDRLVRLAAEKDRGFSLRFFDEMLGRFERFRREEFDLSDLDYGTLSRSVPRWQERVRELALGKVRDQDLGREIDL